MKKQLFTLVVTASFLSVVKPALADTQPVNADSELQKVAAQTTALESEVSALRKEIRQLKTQQTHLKKETEQRAAVPAYPAATVSVQPAAASSSGFRNSPVTYLSGTPVLIAPYIGEHSAFDSFDLITNYSSYNLDLNLLHLRQQMDKQYVDAGLPVPNSPSLMLSGKVEGQAIYSSPYYGQHTSKIDLSGAELDVIPTIDQWANGYFAFAYDHSALPGEPLVANSRAYVKRAFLTFGNLDKYPVYMTVGQLDVPFGDYGSYMISDNIAQDIFQTRARTLLLGYQGANGLGPYAQVFAFNGDSNTNHNNNANNVGANIGFKVKDGIYKADLGVSGIANVADSMPMQNTGNSEGFEGFSMPIVTPTGVHSAEFLQRQVPGLAVHGSLGIGQFGFLGRYVGATSAFAPQDMTFNGEGAKPRAIDLEAAYNFHVFDKPSVITAGYNKSWDALALGVPENRYMAAFLTSIWHSTIEEIEFRHDVNYPVSDNASGAGVPTPASMKGGSSNTITAQIGIYF